MQVVSQLSLSQAPRGFGVCYLGFPAFLMRLTCLKSAKLRRLMYTVRSLSNCSKECSNVVVLIVVNVLTYT